MGSRKNCKQSNPSGLRIKSSCFVIALACAGAACSGLPNGTGNGEQVESSQEALLASDVWTIENAARWTIVQGNATKTTSTTHSEGSASLSLTASNVVAVKGDAVSKPSA